MKKLLISLSVLFVLFFSGCAPSSLPKPKSNTQRIIDNKVLNDLPKYKKACSLNNGFGCREAGVFYDNGYGVKQDYLKAKKYYRKACSLNYGSGCTDLGRLYYHGRGVKQDYLKAKTYYRKACYLNDSNGCILVGGLYKDGKGVKQDSSEANTYFGIACALKNQTGCTLHNAGLKFIGGMLLQGLSY